MAGRRRGMRPGDLVTNEDVASYGSLSCKHCNGSGWLRRDLQKTCDCAKERFLASNLFRVFPDAENDALRWGPHPPTADELHQVSQRVGNAWVEFSKLTKPDKIKDEP